MRTAEIPGALKPLRLSPVRLCQRLHLQGWENLHAARRLEGGGERGVVLTLLPPVSLTHNWVVAALAAHLYLGPLAMLDENPFDRWSVDAALLHKLRLRLPRLRREPPIFGSREVVARHLRQGGTAACFLAAHRPVAGSRTKPATQRGSTIWDTAQDLARRGDAALLLAHLDRRGRHYYLYLQPHAPPPPPQPQEHRRAEAPKGTPP